MNEKQQGHLQIIGAHKWFGESHVIGGVDLEVAAGEFAVFVGPSGCGKSTLLRMIAGLEEASEGKIILDGKDITAEQPANRRLAMVFQSYALYPHLTVRENLGFSLQMAGGQKDDIAAKVSEAARALRLEELLERYPKMLSGGQRQRVAIGRAIVREPLAFLFDEPLSNLDAALRVQMRFEIAKLRETLRATMIYVTHDQIEAMTLADRIIVLRAGVVEQVGTPRELYERPTNRFVAGFIGSPKMNMIENPAEALPTMPLPEGTKYLGIRAEHLTLASSSDANEGGETIKGEGGGIIKGEGAGIIKGVVVLAEYTGSDIYAYVDCSKAGTLTARLPATTKIKTGEKITLKIIPNTPHHFNAQGNRC